MLFLQFSRSCVGGSTVLPFPAEFSGESTTCVADTKDGANENDIFFVAETSRPREDNTDLRFESRFESGNLGKVVKITDTYYQLYLRRDLYTQRHTQWYYFKVSNTRSRITYRYKIEEFRFRFKKYTIEIFVFKKFAFCHFIIISFSSMLFNLLKSKCKR